MDFSFIIPKNSDPYPYNEDQEAWLKELETTERKKGRGWLAYKDTYCCLGIACVKFDAIRSQQFLGGDAFKVTPEGSEESQHLPMPLVYRLRLRGSSGMFAWPLRIQGYEYPSLVSMNDALGFEVGKPRELFTFKDIATYIRHDPWNVFLSDAEMKQRYEGIPLP